MVWPEGFFEGAVNDSDSLKMKRSRCFRLRGEQRFNSISSCGRPTLGCMGEDKEGMLWEQPTLQLLDSTEVYPLLLQSLLWSRWFSRTGVLHADTQ